VIDAPIPLIDQVAAATVVVATVLLALALRGRRASDHPVCRRCGFDLFGKPETSTRCGECGADLNRRRAIRRGRRQRRTRLAWLSLLLVAVAGAKLGLDGYHVSREHNWARYKPASWLAREIELSSPSDVKLRDESRAEILRRLNVRQLSATWVDRLTQRALAIQADPSKPWDNWWGDFVQDARTTNQLSDDAWHQYLGHAWPMHLEAPPLQRRGQPVIVSVVRDPPRHGKTFTLSERSVLTARLGSQRVQAWSASSWGRRYPVGDALLALGPDEADAVGDGPLSVSAAREMHVSSRTTTSTISPSAVKVLYGADEFTGTVILPEVTTTIVPADHVVLDRDPAAADAVRRAVSLTRCTYGLPPDDAPGGAGGFGAFVVTFRVNSPPQPLAFEVLLRTDSEPSPPPPFRNWAATGRPAPSPRGPRYFPIGQLTCPARFQGELVARYDDVPDFRLKTYTIVLRPSVGVAQRAGLASASGEEIVFTDVKVERPGAR
jgi:hypothetical protein